MVYVDKDLNTFGRYKDINIRVRKNATNGDVIKTIFKDRDLSIIQERLEHTHWWNAPYKKGEGDGE